jgi:hypothetical protein
MMIIAPGEGEILLGYTDSDRRDSTVNKLGDAREGQALRALSALELAS